MVEGVETSRLTRFPSVNYLNSIMLPSFVTNSLTTNQQTDRFTDMQSNRGKQHTSKQVCCVASFNNVAVEGAGAQHFRFTTCHQPMPISLSVTVIQVDASRFGSQ
jgi:hypothetical protein